MTTEAERGHCEIEVRRTYLEITDPAELLPARRPPLVPDLLPIPFCSPNLYRFFYTGVGGRYHWVDRLPWTDQELAEHLSRAEISIWAPYVDRRPCGYFELEQHAEEGGDLRGTEIAYFGLLPEFTGQGLGGWLLTEAVKRAWADGARRVWMHTCSLDHPAALPNYLARGFKPFREERYALRLPGGGAES